MAAAVSTPADLSPAPAPAPIRRGRPPKNPAPADPASPLAAPAEEVIGDYERKRAARIRENMERMQKLGILDLAHTLSQSAAAASGRKRWQRKPVEPGSVDGARVKPAPPPPSRRSLRLKDVEPVSYCETEPKKEKHCEDGKTVVIEVGAKEEIYTEEHDKLLGTCNTPWTLFVDGYGKRWKAHL